MIALNKEVLVFVTHQELHVERLMLCKRMMPQLASTLIKYLPTLVTSPTRACAQVGCGAYKEGSRVFWRCRRRRRRRRRRHRRERWPRKALLLTLKNRPFGRSTRISIHSLNFTFNCYSIFTMRDLAALLKVSQQQELLLHSYISSHWFYYPLKPWAAVANYFKSN